MVFAGTGVWKSKRGTPLLGCRCVFINDEQYGYNVRNELIAADEVSYAYDDIGNRTTAEGKTYTANNLNQYTAIDDFTPQYDDDGNQTLVKTETGVWSVTYNAENRPVRWQSGDTVITMAFDRMGRRVEYQETRAGQVATHFRFVYDNFLCVQRLNAANGNAVRTEFVWDPTEPIATRPLVMRAKNWDLNLFYTHDGNKNVSEVFYHALQNGIAAHYDYAPFGAVSRTSRATRVTNRDLLSENPFRFSSEYHDATLGLVYYNYRHYNPQGGRWSGRDRIEEDKIKNRFLFIQNAPTIFHDHLGLITTMSQYMEQAEVTHKASAAVAEDLREKAHNWFMQWYNENEDLSWIKELPPCPCCLTVKGGKFSPPEDPNFKKTLSEKPKEHPGAAVCIRSIDVNGAGEQCCYDQKGKLITGGLGAGTPDRASGGFFSLDHGKKDGFPFYVAKFLDGVASTNYRELYLKRRPPQNKNNCEENII